MKCSIVALSLMLAAPAAAETAAYSETGNTLLGKCSKLVTQKTPEQMQRALAVEGMQALSQGLRDQLEFTHCLGFLTGVLDMMNKFRTAAGKGNCAAGVTGRQVMDVTIRYLTQHPETRHRPAVELAVDAIGRAFCPDPPTVSRIPEQPKPEWQPVPVKKPLKPLPLDTE